MNATETPTTFTISCQRLRNLTTGILHTKMEFVYEDLNMITGQDLFTHMLPGARAAILPWLRLHVIDERFWRDEWDKEHLGEVTLPIPTEQDRKAFSDRYFSQPSLLAGKQVVPVVVNS